MTKKRTDLERMQDFIERDNSCRDDNERGYWRKRLRDLEQGIKDENSADN
jgi:hypothetical protein